MMVFRRALFKRSQPQESAIRNQRDETEHDSTVACVKHERVPERLHDHCKAEDKAEAIPRAQQW